EMRLPTGFFVVAFIVVMFPLATLISPARSELGSEEDRSGRQKDALGYPLPEGCLARCGTMRMRVEGGARSIAYGLDGKILAAATGGEVRLFNSETGAPVEPEVIDASHVVACSPDGKWLAAFSQKGLHLHDLVKGDHYKVPAGPGMGVVP